MTIQTADVVICGAGIAGVSTAYHLAVQNRVGNVLLVDERPPLSLTSDKSTECYRNWWPGPGDGMVSMMNRSIDILESLARESGNIFHLNRRGYLFVTSDPQRLADLEAHAEEAASLGAGAVRHHTGDPENPPYHPAPLTTFENQPTGSDLITDPKLIRAHFPYLAPETIAVVHARRCGWFSAQQLGMYLLGQAREAGVTLLQAKITDVETKDGRVHAVHMQSSDGPIRVATRHLVNAAGPLLQPVGRMLGVELPVFSELHIKVSIKDHRGIFPRQAPLIIWCDPQNLPWSEEEREFLASEADTSFMLSPFPEGVHARPDGPEDSPIVLILWTYDTSPVEPTFPPEYDPFYPEIAMRGLATMLPGLEQYFGRWPKPVVDGGYYTKTQENRPLVGPLPVEGAWVIGALSGFGQMASPACAELLAAHITGAELPAYAHWFMLERYDDPGYQDLLRNWERSGQL
jgi:glycine/D-amino acid oxidase-like deaminating enzyme